VGCRILSCMGVTPHMDTPPSPTTSPPPLPSQDVWTSTTPHLLHWCLPTCCYTLTPTPPHTLLHQFCVFPYTHTAFPTSTWTGSLPTTCLPPGPPPTTTHLHPHSHLHYSPLYHTLPLLHTGAQFSPPLSPLHHCPSQCLAGRVGRVPPTPTVLVWDVRCDVAFTCIPHDIHDCAHFAPICTFIVNGTSVSFSPDSAYLGGCTCV